ncbi:MAG: hypothetical protein ACPLUL_12700 [Thermanaerothrix sp.]|uniref:hypothetical protein n=1 Tax=Thermanaerothrix sp. TaxID=2972675 RepID=UPI003C7ECA5C
MNEADPIANLVLRLAELGRAHPSAPDLTRIEPFEPFFHHGNLDALHLDKRDGALTRREVLTRLLLLSAVLDQGPDILGLREMVTRFTNELYRREIRFLHKPILFFEELGIAIEQLLEQHEAVRKLRAGDWAAANRTNPRRYNLFMDNAHQALGYAVFRWGVPLALIYLLERESDGRETVTALLDYLESYPSTEIMTQQLKDHTRYGLGKAIGDKAAHLFGKWLVTSYPLTRRTDDLAWQGLSYEVPYDSNAGRVLWRTGYLLHWASEEDYLHYQVLQPRRGKGGTTYIRVTNLRGKPLGKDRLFTAALKDAYDDVCRRHLKTHRRAPAKVEIQRIQHAYLLRLNQQHQPPFAAGHFDDGLIYAGTTFCFNHAQPDRSRCPLRDLCRGYNETPALITSYRT